jgi:uncharacterized protein
MSDFLSSGGAALELRPCNIFVDEEGEWFHEGNKIVRKEILQLLYESLKHTSDKRFILEWKQDRCILDVADTPFVISRVDRVAEDGEERIVMRLKHLVESETLDPLTLRVGEDNVLYCEIRGENIPARFSRPAYYQLGEWIEEDPSANEFYIQLNGVKYVIRTSASSIESK